MVTAVHVGEQSDNFHERLRKYVVTVLSGAARPRCKQGAFAHAQLCGGFGFVR